MNFCYEISYVIAQRLDVDVAEIATWFEIPPQSEFGDYAFPCFRLAKAMRQAPAAIAAELAPVLTQELDFVERCEAVSGYVNVFIYPEIFATDTMQKLRQQGAEAGRSSVGAGKRVIVEYSSPNIAKPFHVGHAFSTLIGEALANFFAWRGYEVVRMNHLGDYGTQFGKLMTAWGMYGDEEALEAHPIAELQRVYVKFHQEEANDPSLTVKGRESFKRLEEGEPAEVALWSKFRELSLREFLRIYERFGIVFDNTNGESFYSDKIPAVVEMLEQKGLLVESEGARVVMLDKYNLSPCLVLKSDGSTIYASRDLAAVYYRDKVWDFAKNIYVVGLPQKHHFAQLFAVLQEVGFDKAQDCHHVAFGEVKLPTGSIQTRLGNAPSLEVLMDECVGKTSEIIAKNNPEMSVAEVSETAENVGISAVVYPYLRNSRERDIVFDLQEILDFEGDTAPYLLYTLTRCFSVLRKAESQGLNVGADSSHDALLVTAEERELLGLLRRMDDVLEGALKALEPSIVARYLASLCRSFNRYYHNQSILRASDEKLILARLGLVKVTADVMTVLMHLLGLKPVSRM